MEIWIIRTSLPGYSSWGHVFGYWYDEQEAIGWLNELIEQQQLNNHGKFVDMIDAAATPPVQPSSINNMWRNIALTNVEITSVRPQSNKPA